MKMKDDRWTIKPAGKGFSGPPGLGPSRRSGLPTTREVFVEHTDGLQISLDDGRADELHAAPLQLLGNLLGER